MNLDVVVLKSLQGLGIFLGIFLRLVDEPGDVFAKGNGLNRGR